ncbi:MAG: phosphate/phosphite/phosphonate ABC transporter substrate-binding protein [Planctomycetes bacterium]|nr:phosphate/phosphite/phosphonate ABC transporter substrate-binding protein [Planctomycetota bacterium]
MSKLMTMKMMAVTIGLLLWSGVSTASAPVPQARMTPVQAAEIKEIRISAIPDADAKAIEEKCNLLSEYLTKKVGLPVKFMAQQNYAACVTGLATDQLEVVWFGGVTAVQADQKMDGKCAYLACRESDLKYKSYFIANKNAKIGQIKSLLELSENEAASEWNFTFGSKSSTSGHVMPRHFFQEQAGEKPEDVFKKVAYSGNHDATLRNVADGTADVGAINYKNWDNAKDDLAKAKEKCELIYTTPAYVDYVFMARNSIGEDLIKKLKDALLALDAKDETQNKILASWGAKDSKMVECKREDWSGIRKILDAGVDVGG